MVRGYKLTGFLGQPIQNGNIMARNDPPRVGQSKRRFIPDDEDGIRIEIDRMVDYVGFFSGKPSLIQAARTIVLECPDADQFCEIASIYDFVNHTTRFVQDPYNKEALSTPDRMLLEIETIGIASGDCDDLATFLATLISAIGIEVRFRFGGTKQQGIHHVWVQANVSEKWVDMDPSLKKIGKRGQVLKHELGTFHKFQVYEYQEIY